jgi:hypothetical protein
MLEASHNCNTQETDAHAIHAHDIKSFFYLHTPTSYHTLASKRSQALLVGQCVLPGALPFALSLVEVEVVARASQDLCNGCSQHNGFMVGVWGVFCNNMGYIPRRQQSRRIGLPTLSQRT